MRRIVLLALLVSWTAACRPPSTSVGAPSLVVAVRHAEKVDDSRDPDLTEAGYARARALAALLRDADIARVFSTDFARTRETARPLASELGVEIEIYDPSDPSAIDELIQTLRAPGVRSLVVGHSNSTPDLVRRLGGEPGEPIDETEYDRVYLVVSSASGTLTSRLRFSP